MDEGASMNNQHRPSTTSTSASTTTTPPCDTAGRLGVNNGCVRRWNDFLVLWITCSIAVLANSLKKQLSSTLVPTMGGPSTWHYTIGRLLLLSSIFVLGSAVLLKRLKKIHSKQEKTATPSRRTISSMCRRRVARVSSVENLCHANCDRKRTRSQKRTKSAESGQDRASLEDHVDTPPAVVDISNHRQNVLMTSSETQTDDKMAAVKSSSSVGVMTAPTAVDHKATNTYHRVRGVARAVGTPSNGGTSKKKIRRAQKTLEEVEENTRQERTVKVLQWRHSIRKYRDKMQNLVKLKDDRNKLLGYASIFRMATQKDVEKTALSVRSLREKLNNQCQQNDQQYGTIKSKTAMLKTLSQFISIVPVIGDAAK